MTVLLSGELFHPFILPSVKSNFGEEGQSCSRTVDTKVPASAQWETLALNAHFRASKLARLCNVSLRTLQRHFAKHYGITIGQWLTTIRMHHAYSRLKQAQSVKEVAMDLGYTQVSNFSG